jgi:mono/diheme cytochrome c family protein
MHLERVRARQIAGLIAAIGVAVVAVNGSAALRGQEKVQPDVAVIDYDMTKVAVPPPISADAFAGKKLFVQRCALCHDLLGQPALTTVGPWVDAQTVETRGEAAVRQTILNGSRRMPGWRYTLAAAQIDQLIAYLRTVEPGQQPRPPGQVVVPLD